MAKESINFYLRGGSSVYFVMLDASKAYDKVEYHRLFQILIKKKLCPTLILIFNQYLQQSSMYCGKKLSDSFKAIAIVWGQTGVCVVPHFVYNIITSCVIA